MKIEKAHLPFDKTRVSGSSPGDSFFCDFPFLDPSTPLFYDSRIKTPWILLQLSPVVEWT